MLLFLSLLCISRYFFIYDTSSTRDRVRLNNQCVDSYIFFSWVYTILVGHLLIFFNPNGSQILV